MDSSTSVSCPTCGQSNEVADTGAFRCGRCGALISAELPGAGPRGWWGRRGAFSKLLLLIIAFVIVAAFAIAAWPVSAWFGFCLFGGWLLRELAASTFPADKDAPYAILRPTLRLALQNLSKAILYVGLGIGLVGLIQTALFVADEVSPEGLRKAELFLSDLRQAMGGVLGLEKLLIALGVLILISMLFPRSRLMAQMLRVRTGLGRIYLVLLGITSFTFFTAMDVQFHEEKWHREARVQARLNLDKAEQLSREVASFAWVEESAKSLADDQRAAAVRLFAHLAEQATAKGDLTRVVQRLASKAPTIAPTAVERTPFVSSSMEAHIRSHGRTGQASPTLRQVEQAAAQLSTRVARLTAVRIAMIEAASESVASALSVGNRPLAREFVEQLAGSLSRGALSRVVPSAESIAVARAWVGANLVSPSSAEGAASNVKWAWDTVNFETKPAPHLLPVRPAAPHAPRLPGTMRPFGVEPHASRLPAPSASSRWHLRFRF
jgi:hypothetical protein